MTSNENAVVRDLERITATTLSEVGREAVASLLASAGRFEVGKPVTALGEDGAEVEAEAWFRATISRFPAFIATTPAETKPEPETTGNRTERAIAKVAAYRSSENKAKQAEELVSKFGNPYRTKNLSHQYFVQNFAPELAARLKMEA